MALRDSLAAEEADHRAATAAAAQGRSITGLSGRHAELDQRFSAGDQMFGERVAGPTPEPLVSAPPLSRPRPAGPPERKPFGDGEQALSYPTRPGYRRYWANDKPGRIRRFKEAGYSHVLDPDTGEPVGKVTSVIDGRGQSSYLMEIPVEWYQQDMAQNADKLERRLNDIKSGRNGQDVTVENSYSRIQVTGR